jgi:hypothetical protein
MKSRSERAMQHVQKGALVILQRESRTSRGREEREHWENDGFEVNTEEPLGQHPTREALSLRQVAQGSGVSKGPCCGGQRH